ncbi:hypothetical protein [Streptomyces sp. NPDC046805]|uniref:hypothetical protein n=1 Tax=Streptomyces sp. NPDC046805 TaxID=3155134 RepID=UPI0034083ACB
MSRSLKPYAAALAALAFVFAAAAPATSAPDISPGDPDTSFGVNGRTTTDFGATPSEPEIGNDLVRGPNGELYVIGRRGVNVVLAGGESSFGLAKYTPDGHLDTSFGKGGLVTTDFGDGVGVGRALLLLPDGKLIAGGFTQREQIADVALAKYNPDGSLDTSFGDGGKVRTDLSGGLGDGIRGLALTKDGKILAAGASGPDSFVARYLPDGHLDPTFGNGGVAKTDFGLGDHLFALDELPDGKIIGAGTSNGDFLLARFNPDGTLDTSFGQGGSVHTDMSGQNDLAFGFAHTADGYLITGAANAPDPFGATGPIRTAVARYHTDGTLDTSFGGDGKVTTDVDPVTADEGREVAVDSQGRVVVAGLTGEVSAFPLDPTAGDMLVTRYRPDGTLDTSFGGGDGISTVDFNGGADAARGLVLTGNDDIIVGGGAVQNAPYSDFALAKLHG